MNKVLFEIRHMGDISGNIQLIVGAAALILLYFWAKSNENKAKREKDAKLFSTVSKVVLTYIVLLMVFRIKDYKDIVISYKNGNYVEIEGTVENYSTSLKEDVEYFTVDGVRFECSYYSPAWGYTKQRRNEIIINGRHLKIRYIPLRHENVIVYIEQMMPEEWDTD